MEIKAKSVIGLKVIAIDDGSQMDKVNDIIYDPKENKITALILSSGGLFSSAKAVLYSDVKSIGDTAVMVPSSSVVKKISELTERVSHIAKDDDLLTKTKVISEAGNVLGSVDDLAFEMESGRVTKFIISQGIIGNIKSGTKSFTLDDVITLGKDNVIVKKYTEEKFEEQSQNQGVQGALNSAKEHTQDTVSSVQDKANALETKDKVSSTIEDAKSKSKDFIDKAQQFVKEKISDGKDKAYDVKIKSTLGKYLTKNILGQNDEVIAKKGTMINHELINIAQENGMLEQVLSNASQDVIQAQPPTQAII